MKRLITIFCFVLTFVSSVSGESLIFVADKWDPINSEPQSDKPGFVIELLHEIYTSAGHQFEYRVVPWPRAVKWTSQGKFNAVISATKDNAKQLLLSKEPFGILENDFFTGASNRWRYRDIDSLKTEKVGVILGYHYGKIESYLHANKNTDAVQYVGGNTPLINNFRKLFLGRITVLVDWEPVVNHTAALNGWSSKIRHAGKSGNKTPLLLGFTKGREDLMNIWDRGLQRSKQNGIYKEILEKYNLSLRAIGF